MKPKVMAVQRDPPLNVNRQRLIDLIRPDSAGADSTRLGWGGFDPTRLGPDSNRLEPTRLGPDSNRLEPTRLGPDSNRLGSTGDSTRAALTGLGSPET